MTGKVDKTKVIIGVLVLVIIVLAVLLVMTQSNNPNLENSPSAPSATVEDAQNIPEIIEEIPVNFSDDVEWNEIEMVDVKSGKVFKIKDFVGKPILIHPFNLNCQSCLEQNINLKRLHESVLNTSILVSIDVDTRDKRSDILSYIVNNQFNWYFVSSPQVTYALSKEFGKQIESVDFVPRILICQDQIQHPIEQGVKTSTSLREAVERECYPEDS